MEARDALAQWERDGLIDGELASRLADSLSEGEKQARTNNVIRLLVGIGAVLIGGGLLLFIASHWDSQSPIRRVGLLVLVYALVVAAAAVADRQRLETTGRGLWFLSSITVGVNIFLLGQIFNLPLNFWQGTLLWMIAALAMGWASPSVLQGWLVVVLGVLTLGWISVPSSQFFDQGAFLWEEGGIRPLLPLLGLAMAAGSSVGAGTDFAFLRQPSRAIGVLLIAVPLTVSTFHPFLFGGVWQMDARFFHVVLAIACVAVIGLVWWRAPSQLLLWALPTLGVLLAALLIQVEPDPDTPNAVDEFDSTSWLAEPIARSELLLGVYTALIFALALATVIAGQRFRVAALVNVGLAVIAVLVIAVYTGRIAGALPTSIAVLLGGVLLVAGAVFLERKRRDSDRGGDVMRRRHVIAVAVAVLAMVAVLLPPLWIRVTGDEVTLEIEPVDPLSFFRGNYVDLRYDVDMPREVSDLDGSVYAVFADERPGRLLRVTEGRPDLDDGEFCVRGEAMYGSLFFPHLEQFFVTPERGQVLERRLSDMVAVLKVTGGCRAVLVDIELE